MFAELQTHRGAQTHTAGSGRGRAKRGAGRCGARLFSGNRFRTASAAPAAAQALSHSRGPPAGPQPAAAASERPPARPGRQGRSRAGELRRASSAAGGGRRDDIASSPRPPLGPLAQLPAPPDPDAATSEPPPGFPATAARLWSRSLTSGTAARSSRGGAGAPDLPSGTRHSPTEAALSRARTGPVQPPPARGARGPGKRILRPPCRAAAEPRFPKKRLEEALGRVLPPPLLSPLPSSPLPV